MFLGTLAYTARGSEIHAINRKFEYAPEGSYVKLILFADFLPKKSAIFLPVSLGNSVLRQRNVIIRALLQEKYFVLPKYYISGDGTSAGKRYQAESFLRPGVRILIFSKCMHTLTKPEHRRVFVSFK